MKITETQQEETYTSVAIKNVDFDKRIAYGEVYSPYVIDSHGDIMLPEDIELMAHRFMQLKNLDQAIDTEHDNVPNGSYPVESFIAREGDPYYAAGSWVLGIKINDFRVWNAVKSGELNGFSFQATVKKMPVVVEVDVPVQNIGATEVANNHRHLFFLEVDKDGRIKSGRTSTDNGHAHEIKAGTATESAQGHSHRIFV